jgi:hypothetical protein
MRDQRARFQPPQNLSSDEPPMFFDGRGSGFFRPQSCFVSQRGCYGETADQQKKFFRCRDVRSKPRVFSAASSVSIFQHAR